MIISVQWLKQFTQIDASIDELAEVIGARLVEIEGVESLGDKYKDVVIARVVECAPVEDSDHLNVTRIDDGGVTADVERGDDGLIQVVCGAPNVRSGLLVAWLPPGSTVPETFADSDPFVLGARKLRGLMSNGMLASARELDLFDDHEGILEIDKDVAPGTPFMDAYALDDDLLDIENKSLTHRPDTFGIIGFAREVAAIAGSGFTAPAWYEAVEPDYGVSVADPVALTVAIDDPKLASRYQAVVLGGFAPEARTPLEVQTYLSRSGVRPISPIVDVTNYLMLLTGQPLHAFDYDKVLALTGSSHLHVREGFASETLTLLDGRTITLAGDDIVVAAGDRAIALAGAMGGAETEIDASTTRIILESATFNLYNLRRTQMRHGIFSEAITRFTKGQPAALTAPVLAQAIAQMKSWTQADVLSQVADDYAVRSQSELVHLDITTINTVLGTKFSIDDAVETLTNVQFSVEVDGENLAVTAPYWRTDIHAGEDIIEEIGRLNGFDTIEPVLSTRDFTAVMPDALQSLRQSIRCNLSAAGANEVLTYGFVHGDLLKRAGQLKESAYALDNAISPDLQYYRLSITPSLLEKVSQNLRQNFDEFALFEFGKTHVKEVADPAEPDLPMEFGRIALTYVASAKRAAGRGNAYYTARRYLDHVLHGIHIENVILKAFTVEPPIDIAALPFEPKRSASIFVGNTYIGVIGEYERTVQNAFKLPAFSAGFELLTEPLLSLAKLTGAYIPLSRFPGSDSDSTFVVLKDTTYGELQLAVARAIAQESVMINFVPIDSFVPEHGNSTNFTLRFSIVSYDKTLTRTDVNEITGRLTSEVVRLLPSVTLL